MIKVIFMLHDGMRVRIQLECGDFSAWFNACQGLQQECLWSPLLFNIFFAAVITAVLQRFAEDPLIVLDLVYLDDVPKCEDYRPREEGTLKMFRRAVWGMLYAIDAEVVSTTHRGLTRMIDIIVVACQEFELAVLEKKTEAMQLWFHPSTASNVLRMRRQGICINKRQNLCISVVQLSRARTSTPRLRVASAPLGRVSEDAIPKFTEPPAVAQDRAIQS